MDRAAIESTGVSTMAQLTLQHDVPPIVERKLAQVRRGIRTYVWLEGLAARGDHAGGRVLGRTAASIGCSSRRRPCGSRR